LDAIKPIQYLENKDVLNKALERLNWPISLKELSVLENEILVGKMYIQQALELQETSRKNYQSKTLQEVGPLVPQARTSSYWWPSPTWTSSLSYPLITYWFLRELKEMPFDFNILVLE
jgi:hypothetical protein